MVEAICFKNGRLTILNQLKLPLEEEYLEISSVKDAFDAIHSMKVRGAPAIAIVAIISIAIQVSALKEKFDNKKSLFEHIKSQSIYICTSRPTAVNIKKECDSLVEYAHELCENSDLTIDEIIGKILEYASQILDKDITVNKLIGDYGAQQIIGSNENTQISILTHCNTGSLATAGYGTALGVIRSLHSMGKLNHAYCTETRPYNQGARLTSWELIRDKIPSTLICDDMAAALMRQTRISAVVVGADRVVSNGDTANKIGTYQLAVIAKYHNVPFYVASPQSTIDMSLNHGDDIPIEERPDIEMKCIGGVQIAPKEMQCWNPAFDVTPAQLITGGIITEFGVFPANQLIQRFK